MIKIFNGVSLTENTSANDVSFINTKRYLFRRFEIILRLLLTILKENFVNLRNKNTKISFLYQFTMIQSKEKLLGRGVCILLCLSLWSCRNEKSWFYKQWHNTLAHYNTYFNAEQKWLETVDLSREAYVEDFRKPIELFNYGTVEALKGNQSSMDDVIKRASTMIDRHPKSKWVDDAYLLIGKAYLFKGDVNAALEIFDIVSTQYKDPEIQFTSKLWMIKGLLLNGKIIEAEAATQSILANKDLPKKLLPQAQFTLANIYHKQKKFKQSSELLLQALPYIHDRMDKYRSFFALGQAFQAIDEYELAEKYYSKIYRFNPPYEIAFNAQISRVELLSVKQKNYSKANQILLSMLKDDKNIEYIGQIYYRLGKNELNAKRINQAIGKFKISAIHSKQDPAQKTTSFLSIGDIYYNQKLYELAGIYYDSANQSLDEKHPDFDAIVAKNEIFGDLLKNLIKIKYNDSLVRMVNDKDWRKVKIKEAIQREKNEEARAKLPQPKPPGNMNQLPGNPDMNNGMANSNSSFPFYNMLNRKKGEDDFIKNWGKRDNKDFWRYSSRKQSVIVNNANDTSTATPGSVKNSQTVDSTLFTDVPKEEKRFYAQLPLSPSNQEEKSKETEIAIFKCAEIYQNRLQDFNQAIYHYTNLLNRYPKTEYYAQALYELVKLNRLVDNVAEAERLRAELETKFPQSIYRKLLDNPNQAAAIENTDKYSTSKEITNYYDSMVRAYQEGKYDVAKNIKMGADKSYAGNNYQPRFDFVYALCALKLKEPKALEYFEQITVDYPNTDVSERAHNILDFTKRSKELAALPKDSLAKKAASDNTFEKHNGKTPLNCILIVPKGTNINMLKAGISDLNKKEYSLDNIQIGVSVNIGSKYIISIENFTTPDKAKFYQQYLSKQTDFFASKSVFEFDVVWITQPNFQLLVKNLTIADYLQLFKEGKM